MKLIIFDVDGVLFDTIPYAIQVFTERHPGVTEEMYREIHMGNYYENSKKYSHLKINETPEEEESFRLAYAKKKSQTALFSGIKELLQALHSKGYKLVINSNAYNRNCLSILESSDILQFFDFVATADLSPDKVKKFKIIEDKYQVGKTDILFITDALGDLRDADTAGVPTVAVTWGVHDALYFQREPHANLVAIVDSVRELQGVIDKR